MNNLIIFLFILSITKALDYPETGSPSALNR